jgi:hypothetical protein
MVEYWYLIDQSLDECREGISPFLRGRHHEDLELRVVEQEPAHKGTGQPGFADPSKGFDDGSSRSVL